MRHTIKGARICARSAAVAMMLATPSACGGPPSRPKPDTAATPTAPSSTVAPAAAPGAAPAKARTVPPAADSSTKAAAPTPKPLAPLERLHPVQTWATGLEDPSTIVADDQGIFAVTWEKRRAKDVVCLNQFDADGNGRKNRYCSAREQYDNDISLALSPTAVFMSVRTSDDFEYAVVQVPRRPAPSRVLANVSGLLSSLSITGDTLFFGTSDGVGSIAIRTGTVTDLATESGAAGGIAWRGDRLFYASIVNGEEGVREARAAGALAISEAWRQLAGSDTHLFGVAHQTEVWMQSAEGTTTKLGPIDGGPLTVGDDGNPYWADTRDACSQTSDGRSRLMMFSLREERAVILAEVAGCVEGLAAVGGQLIFTTGYRYDCSRTNEEWQRRHPNAAGIGTTASCDRQGALQAVDLRSP